ncbi:MULTISPECIES: MraY family glycosyltransferase [Sphingobacterium]|uniref:MraY family glycosyltransferase n=1 Tax=Sphingobacterium TaxID=28453 RepID=UPI001050DA7F|nr:MULTISPECIES: glycosyltransferase family 4 protein [Sphingobacterium]MCW2262050.1 UDP-N-acetylmuramyl pentapeptide phosphotransferase/UDP-N-acetylglucosamine-1-phosphate transferase [Sphingobacterium kitahiroshimense]NJI74993.1 glycosyltransferase family 4 protein [Sphingobacterium sp. B16(2022)]TCR13202.1 UDP-N-acetylmuramyl pentapeptide phosphotransferase/UDP-N-acetylglucosamine-1-phosphate transferase [Sphingobacterium sp. JUb78]
MNYLIVLIILFVLELLYFKVADRFNIIDKPNERSSHSTVTLRGGGIIFYFGAFIYFILSGFQYPYFFLGLTLMTAVSFLDDVFTLSNKIRLVIHFSSVLLMTYQLDLFSMPWYYLLITFIIVVGVINAYNFMDGINGITACYSLAVGALLMIVNHQLNFIQQDLLSYTLLGVLVFAFFNFRNKAKCFAGDVGAVAIAFVLLFALGALIIQTGNLIYILFLSVYGIDAVWTIVRRLLRKENIFEAHRSHLYQFLGNEAKVNKLVISFCYGLIQLLIGLLVIQFSDQEAMVQIIFAVSLLVGLSAIYLILKTYIIKKYVH